jgi:hypothetical protein
MATKKKPAKKKGAKKAAKVSAKSTPILKFDPRRFTDPGPDSFRNLSSVLVKQLEQARKQFVNQVNAILKGR